MPLAYWCHVESTYYNSFGVAYNNLVFALWPKRGTFSNVVSSATTPLGPTGDWKPLEGWTTDFRQTHNLGVYVIGRPNAGTTIFVR